jgi:hypothetical protein
MNTIQLAALKAAIQSGPLSSACAPLVAAGSDLGVAALFNAPDVSLTAAAPMVSLSKLGQWSAATGVRAKIEAAALASSPVQSICLLLRDYLVGLNGPAFYVSDPLNLQMCDALVAAGVLVDGSGASLKASLLALGAKTPATRGEVIAGAGYVVTHADVRQALES